MIDGLDVREFLAGYLAEAEEHLASSTRNLLAVEDALRRGAHDPRAVRELFRSLHTLKGLSAMVGAEPIVDLAHEMESLLRVADRAGGRLTPPAIDVLLRGVRAIEARVGNLARSEPLPPAPRALVEELALLVQPGPSGARSSSSVALALEPELAAKLTAGELEELVQGTAAGQRAVLVEFVPSPERAAAGVNITSVRERVAELGSLVKVMPRARPPVEGKPGGVGFVLVVLTTADDAAIAAATATEVDAITTLAAAGAVSEQPIDIDSAISDDQPDVHRPNVVRVDVGRLDDALERLASMVVGRARLQRTLDSMTSAGTDVRELAVLLREQGRQLRDLRAAIMRARMVRVSELLERAPLIVRGLSKSSGKPIHLAVDAGAAELDKSVGERLLPVIVHLLRNAVDHAIEAPAERAAAGKPPEGHIRITSVERGGTRLELRMTDDGRGIDREAVARKAGGPVPETDAELLDLLVRPGFTTLDAATHTSGRGLGMDIVKRIVVDELGGALGLTTTVGVGTTFRIEVPLSVTIVDAFAFAVGDDTFVTAASAVDELREVEAAAVIDTPRLRGGVRGARLLRLRDGEVPLFALGALLGAAPTQAPRPKAILIRDDRGAVAFEVDRMIGRQEIVVRPIADPLVRVAGIAGTTDLGDGRPTLVLDLAALLSGRRTAAEAS